MRFLTWEMRTREIVSRRVCPDTLLGAVSFLSQVLFSNLLDEMDPLGLGSNTLERTEGLSPAVRV